MALARGHLEYTTIVSLSLHGNTGRQDQRPRVQPEHSGDSRRDRTTGAAADHAGSTGLPGEPCRRVRPAD